MDIILLPPSMKLFISSLVCFSRMSTGSSSSLSSSASITGMQQQQSVLSNGGGAINSNELYMEFHPITGCILRIMNDAKTVYASCSYPPSFFFYCSSSSSSSSSSSNDRRTKSPANATSDVDDDTNNNYDSSQDTAATSSTNDGSTEHETHRTKRTKTNNNSTTISCRISMKALQPILRHHRNSTTNKNIIALQIRSVANHATNNMHRNTTSDDDDDEENNNNNNNSNSNSNSGSSTAPLALEFIFTYRNSREDSNTTVTIPNYSRCDAWVDKENHHGPPYYHQQHYHHPHRMVIHRIPVVDQNSGSTLFFRYPNMTIVHPMMQYERSTSQNQNNHNSIHNEPPSEMIVSAHVLNRLLDPFVRTSTTATRTYSSCSNNEVAFIIRSGKITASSSNHSGNDRHTNTNSTGVGSVSVSSFHHSDLQQSSSTTTATTNSNVATPSISSFLFKTETACSAREFIEFDYVTTRRRINNNDNSNTNNTSVRDTTTTMDDMPENVNDEVILVVPIKELKAMLQFCSSISSSSSSLSSLYDTTGNNVNNLVHVSFHWGGKPLMIQTNYHHPHRTTTTAPAPPSFHMQLILATLDYQLLSAMPSMTSTT